MTALLTIARMYGRDLSRRRLALGMLVALPLVFYLSSASAEGAFVLISGGLGVAWSITGAGMFIGLGSRRIAPRLALAGYRPWQILAGQMVMLVALSIPLIALFSVVVLAGEGVDDPAKLILAVGLTALISVPLGLLLASLVPTELEGTLALIGVLGVQMSLPPDVGFAAVLPFFGPVRLLDHVYGTPVDPSLTTPHALLATVVLAVAAFWLWNRRVRVSPTTLPAAAR